jgi:hypothetical protein
MFEFRPRFLSGQKDAALARTVQRDTGTGKFLIKKVPVGSWRVTMRSGSVLSEDLTSNCDQDFLVDVPESGAVAAAVSVMARGGLRVKARHVNGAWISPEVELLAPDGTPIDGVTARSSAELVRLATNEKPVTSTVLTVWSSWCAGAVDVVVSANGMKPHTVRASLVAGQLTPVDVVLQPK